MKRTILVLFAVSALIVGQDAAGQYKLTGVDVLYNFVARGDYTLTVTDAYGFGVTVPVASIPGGAPFASQAMQLTDAALSAIGINLNVTLNEDGSGAIAEGSFYPDVNTIENEDGSCTTLQQVLPVTDEFTYTSMGNMMEYVGMAHPGVNVLGLPGISSLAGQQLGGLALSSSLTFENFPMFPAHPTLCSPTGDCFPFTVGDIDGSGTLEIYPDVNLLGIPEYVPGGAPLTGLTAGYWLKEGVNAAEGSLSSVFPGNTSPDFHLEWHGVDGADSDLGWGDDRDLDEDDDGTWFDRIVGIPGITATYMNPACGFNMPIYGDVSAVFEAMGMGFCVDYVDAAASAYLMDAALATWGGFMTGNAAQFNGCLAATGGDMAFCAGTYPQFLADDSDHDFNGVDGRLTMNFDIPCVGIIEAREVIAEFIQVGDASGTCTDENACNSGVIVDDTDWACYYGYDDAEGSEKCYTDGTCAYVCDLTCYQDDCGNCWQPYCYDMINGQLVSADETTCVSINNPGNVWIGMAGNPADPTWNAAMDCAGVCGGSAVDTDCGCNETASDGTTGCCADELGPNDEAPDCAGVCGGDDTSCLSIDELTTPDRYSITSVYPNPFNPVINISYGLPENTNIQVVVYDIGGNRIETLLNGFQAVGIHSISWNASSYPSGLYLIRLVGSGFSETQKVVLMK